MTQVLKSWWPASIVLPDKAVWHRCLVFATTDDLRVYRRKGEPHDWGSPIDFEQTPEPRRNPQNIGVDITTLAGVVVITPTGSCGCGNPLRHWRPDWASNVTSWPKSEV